MIRNKSNGPTDAPAWPRDGLDQIRVVRELLVRASAPVQPDAVSASFGGSSTAKRKGRVADVLDALPYLGVAAGVACRADAWAEGETGGVFLSR